MTLLTTKASQSAAVPNTEQMGLQQLFKLLFKRAPILTLRKMFI